jgi:5-(carboxyamino)imidazole ribonucleotide mutase
MQAASVSQEYNSAQPTQSDSSCGEDLWSTAQIACVQPDGLAPLVMIVLGSKSDLGVMEGCFAELEELGVPFVAYVASAHRMPALVEALAKTAEGRGIQVIIAAAGKAAHLGGVLAAYTPLPVIAVPMKTSDLGGLDSLLSMVQMPTGVPVATVAINGAKNAAILATQILGVMDSRWREKIIELKVALSKF